MTIQQQWRSKLEGKKLLVFDFDGTVADTSPLHAAAFARALEPFGVAVDYPAIAGMRTAEAMRRCFELAGQPFPEASLVDLVAGKQAAVRTAIRESLQPLPGVDAFLQWARPKHRLAMVTSGSRGTVGLALAVLGYEGWFDPLITAEDVRQSKPDPEGFLMALRICRCQPAEAMVFEDSDAGVNASLAAGIDCWDVRAVPLNWGGRSPDVPVAPSGFQSSSGTGQ